MEDILDRINTVQSISSGVSFFRLNSLQLTNYLRQQKKQLAFIYDIGELPENSSVRASGLTMKLGKPRRKKIFDSIEDVQKVIDLINEHGSIQLGCAYAGISDTTLKTSLAKSGYRLIRRYIYEDLVDK